LLVGLGKIINALRQSFSSRNTPEPSAISNSPPITPVSQASQEAGQDDADGTRGNRGWLINWPQIMSEVEMDDTEENRRFVREANNSHEGPIIFRGKGSSPRVKKSKLVAWWEKLEDRLRELEEKRDNVQATVAPQYKYGRDETVIPNLQGHVKKRKRGSQQ
jgi:hypothetical protein